MRTILFACTENKKRSKLAEAVFNHLAQKKGVSARAVSAGTIPAESTDPMVVKMLTEHDIPFTDVTPRKLTNEILGQADYIISFGCLVPDLFPKEKFEEWLVDDPKTPEEYDVSYDTISMYVVALLTQLQGEIR